jgi:hypothetical protein
MADQHSTQANVPNATREFFDRIVECAAVQTKRSELADDETRSGLSRPVRWSGHEPRRHGVQPVRIVLPGHPGRPQAPPMPAVTRSLRQATTSDRTEAWRFARRGVSTASPALVLPRSSVLSGGGTGSAA